MNSIEKINYENYEQFWTIIEINSTDLEPRANPCVAPLNSNQFLIVGGKSKENSEEIEKRLETRIFNTLGNFDVIEDLPTVE